MGQVVKPDFGTAFQLSSSILKPAEVRARQIIKNSFDVLVRYDFNIGDLSYTTNNNLRKIGEIWMGAPNEAPDTDNVLCNGDSYDPLEYPEAFAACGYAYGEDNGNFLVPDLRRRSPVGYGLGIVVGQKLGAETADIAHTHTLDIEIDPHVAIAENFSAMEAIVSEAILQDTVLFEIELNLSDSQIVDLALTDITTTWTDVHNGTPTVEISGTTEDAATGITVDTHNDTIEEATAHVHDILDSDVWVTEHAEGVGKQVVDFSIPDTDGYQVNITLSLVHTVNDPEHMHAYSGSTMIDVTHSHEGTASGEIAVNFIQNITLGPQQLDFSHSHTVGFSGGLPVSVDNHIVTGIAIGEPLEVNLYHPVQAVKFLIRLK